MLLNIQAPTRRYVLTIYGASGTGKTTLATTAPKPVVLLLEPQGWESIRDAAPAGGSPVPTFAISTIEQLRQAILVLHTSREPLADLVRKLVPDASLHEQAIASLPYLAPETVVIDSVSEALRLVIDGIEKEAPPRVASDGLPERSERAWGAIGERGERLLRSLRDLTARGYHVLLLAQLDDSEKGKGDDKRRVCAPVAPMQRLQRGFAYVSNAVGITQRDRKLVARRDKDGKDAQPEEQVTWSVRFSGPDWMMLKTVHGLRAIETQNVTSWLKRIAKIDEAKREPAPAGSDPNIQQRAEPAPAQTTEK